MLLTLTLLTGVLCIVIDSAPIKAKGFEIFGKNSVKYGEACKFIVTIQTVPALPFTYHLLTKKENYILEKFHTEKYNKGKWIYSNDIKQIFKFHEIPYKKQPFLKGFYFMSTGYFYKFGNTTLKAEMFNAQSPEINGYFEFDLMVTLNSTCKPILKISKCSNPIHPVQVHIGQFNQYLGYFNEDCNSNYKNYRWTLYDYLGKNVIYKFPNTTKPTLLVKPYTVIYRSTDVYNKLMYMLLLAVKINKLDVKCRCYVKLIPGAVYAIIAGGPVRTVNQYKEVILDGSQSRDYSDPPEENTLFYKWDCYSAKDNYNRYCRKGLSKEMIVRVPANTLKLNAQYVYKLTVISDEDDGITSKTQQTIKLSEKPLIQIAIVCIANCDMDFFNPAEQVNLKGICKDCKRNQRLFYEWFVGGTKVMETPHLTMHISTTFPTAKIQLNMITNDGLKNSVTRILKKNAGPTKGTCRIAPKVGLEATTKFRITCARFESQHMPLEFIYYTKRVITLRCSSDSCTVYLPATDWVIVRICDILTDCVETVLKVKVTHIHIPKTNAELISFFKKKNYNVKELFRKGKQQQAHAILNAVAVRARRSEYLQIILDQFSDYQPNTAIELGKMSNFTRTIMAKMMPYSDNTMQNITKSLKILNDNFQLVIDSGEVVNLGKMSYMNITLSCITMLELFKEATDILTRPPQHIYDAIYNNFDNLTEATILSVEEEILQILDPKIVQRSLIWMRATWQMGRLMNYLGFASTFNLQPDEKMTIITEGIALEIQCFYIDEERVLDGHSIETHDGINTVNFSAKLLRELSEKHIKSKRLCLKVISIIRDLNWWYPDERQPSKRLLSVTAYSEMDKKTHDKVEIKLKNELNFFIVIGKNRPAKVRHKIGVDLHIDTLEQKDEKNLSAYVQGNGVESYEELFWLTKPGLNLLHYLPDPNDTADGDCVGGVITTVNKKAKTHITFEQAVHVKNENYIENADDSLILKENDNGGYSIRPFELTNLTSKQDDFNKLEVFWGTNWETRINGENLVKHTQENFCLQTATANNFKFNREDQDTSCSTVKNKQNKMLNRLRRQKNILKEEITSVPKMAIHSQNKNEYANDYDGSGERIFSTKRVRPKIVDSDEERASATDKFRSTLINSSLFVYEQSLIYRASLDAHSLLAVRFFNTTHDLSVVLKMGSLPKRLEITKSDCIVYKNETKTFLLLNNCVDKQKVYMGVRVYSDHVKESCSELEDRDLPIENGPANFSFVFQIRACDYWVYSADDPYWSQEGCIPGMHKNIASGLHCTCKYLSMYTAYVFNVVAIPVPWDACSYTVMPINMEVVYFHCILFTLLFSLVILTYIFKSDVAPITECVLSEPEVHLDIEPHSIMVHITTGGRLGAGTTANVKIIFQTINGDELEFTLFQDPEHYVLKTNSTHTLKLVTRDIRLPTRLALSHDNKGRYPKWFCHNILLEDMQTHHSQKFIVDKWIPKDTWLVANGETYRPGQHEPGTLFSRFSHSINKNFINWFMFQPLLGDWRRTKIYRELSRYERTCIWVVKFTVTIAISTIYYGKTTIDNYEDNRRRFSGYSLLQVKDVFILGLLCFIASTIIQYVLEFGLVPYTDRFHT